MAVSPSESNAASEKQFWSNVSLQEALAALGTAAPLRALHAAYGFEAVRTWRMSTRPNASGVLDRYLAARNAGGTLALFLELQDVGMSMIEKLQGCSILDDALITHDRSHFLLGERRAPATPRRAAAQRVGDGRSGAEEETIRRAEISTIRSFRFAPGSARRKSLSRWTDTQ